MRDTEKPVVELTWCFSWRISDTTVRVGHIHNTGWYMCNIPSAASRAGW